MDCMGILGLLEKLLFCVVLVCVLVCGRKGINVLLKSLFSPYLLLYGVVKDSEGEELTTALLPLAPISPKNFHSRIPLSHPLHSGTHNL